MTSFSFIIGSHIRVGHVGLCRERDVRKHMGTGVLNARPFFNWYCYVRIAYGNAHRVDGSGELVPYPAYVGFFLSNYLTACTPLYVRRYYAYYLITESSPGEGFGVASSVDGQHWIDHGYTFHSPDWAAHHWWEGKAFHPQTTNRLPACLPLPPSVVPLRRSVS